MPEIPDPHRFEPDKRALKLWLYTRKQDKQYGLNEAPGFFSTHDFPKDQGFFIAAFVLEILGIVLLISSGINLGDSEFALIAIIGALGLSVGDIFLAYLLHRNEEKKCYGRNKIKISENEGEKQTIKDQLKAGKWWDAFIIFLIILIAIIKIFGIVLLGTFDNIGIYISLVIMFLFIVYVHIWHTGYFIYGWLTKRTFKQQLRQLNQGNKKYAAQPWEQPFASEVNLLDGSTELKANENHKIIEGKKEDSQTKHKYSYNIKSQGILTDNDLSSFFRKSLNEDQITLIAKECLKLQIRMYENANE